MRSRQNIQVQVTLGKRQPRLLGVFERPVSQTAHPLPQSWSEVDPVADTRDVTMTTALLVTVKATQMTTTKAHFTRTAKESERKSARRYDGTFSCLRISSLFIIRPAKIADALGRLFRLRFRKGSRSESVYTPFRATREWHVWNWRQIIKRFSNIGGFTKKVHFHFRLLYLRAQI